MTRIEPLEPPYAPEAAEGLAAMMPAGTPPIRLFRAFARNVPMAVAMRDWGRYELSSDLSLSMRDREILIDRTCVRCGCEYEWGIHTVYFAGRVELTPEQVTSLVHGVAADPCWVDERDRLLISAADALHDRSRIDDALWAQLAAEFSDEQLLDLLLLCGWYHAISFAANGAALPREEGTPRFTDLA
ncbi:MAG: carboxymuconolactone decarboxylase [Aeromicrobium sp.]|nr:carboxymuconolactone decarboxylase [Aeromicrobium sp.]